MIVKYGTRDTIRACGLVYIDTRQQLTYGFRTDYIAHRDWATSGSMPASMGARLLETDSKRELISLARVLRSHYTTS